MKKDLLKLVGMALLLCFSVNISAQTPGTLTFTFTTPKHTTGNYETNGRYVIAVWIETSSATFVKTKMRNWGGNTNDHLPTWVTKSGQNVTDATTGSTLATFTAKTITWNGTNVAGSVVADGAYRVAIQETWGHTTNTVTRYFNFTKGTAADNQTPASDTNFTNISLAWAPVLANESFTQSPEAVIYPNPSNGIFNIDFKSEVRNINVINVLGEVVYNEEVNELSTDTTKSIDLSNLTNGVYIVNVSNGNASTNYKVVLNK